MQVDFTGLAIIRPHQVFVAEAPPKSARLEGVGWRRVSAWCASSKGIKNGSQTSLFSFIFFASLQSDVCLQGHSAASMIMGGDDHEAMWG